MVKCLFAFSTQTVGESESQLHLSRASRSRRSTASSWSSASACVVEQRPDERFTSSTLPAVVKRSRSMSR